MDEIVKSMVQMFSGIFKLVVKLFKKELEKIFIFDFWTIFYCVYNYSSFRDICKDV